MVHTSPRRLRKPLLLLAGVLLLLLGCWFLRWYIIYGQYPVYRGQSGSTVIVYVDDGGPGRHLYAMQPDGSDPTRLTYHDPIGLFGLPIGAYFPDLVRNKINGPGPDMYGIYYGSSYERDGFPLYYLPLNGQRFRQVPSLLEDHTNARIAPNGRFLAYRDRDGDLFLADIQDGTRHCLSCTADSARFRYSLPTWSMDSRKVAFSIYDRDQDSGHIHTYDLVTNHITRIPNQPLVRFGDPAWSPDGTRLAVTGWMRVSLGRREGIFLGAFLYVMHADGSHPRQITRGGSDFNAAWSPDGTQLVFEAFRNGRLNRLGTSATDIYRVNVDGTGEVRLVGGTGVDNYTSPTWVIVP
ncbi:MAG: TolB family protein [Chloroflexaceae bacterium]